MDTSEKHSEISDYAATTIRCKARQLIGKAGFTKSDVDDLMQEMTTDLLERLPKFDPNKAAQSTFVARVIERKISKIIRHRMQEKRDYRCEACSVNEYIPDGKGGMIERSQTMPQDEHDLSAGKHHRPEAERVDMHLDISFVISELPPDLKPLAESLLTHSIAEVARELGVPRSTLYETGIARLREIFEDKGLGEYI